MPRFLKYLVLTLMFMLCAGPAFADLSQVCNNSSGLSWQMNSETDMKEYVVYHNESANVKKGSVGAVSVVIPHDTANGVANEDGTFSISHQLTLTKEGPRYFVVTAKDQAGNESGESNEVSCTVDIEPGAPTIKLIFNINPDSP